MRAHKRGCAQCRAVPHGAEHPELDYCAIGASLLDRVIYAIGDALDEDALSEEQAEIDAQHRDGENGELAPPRKRS